MTRRARRAGIVAAACAVLGLALAGCVPDAGTTGTPATSPSPSAAASSSPEPSGSADTSPTPAPSASPSATTGRVSIPSDCRSLITGPVLAQLADLPLNDPAFEGFGVQPDGGLKCAWGYPGTDTGRLITTISRVNRGPALDMLNALADNEGFTCYTPDEGTRCEKTWQNPDYPVTNGRTLYWRSDVLIDTSYDDLAPTGYTSNIVQTLFG